MGGKSTTTSTQTNDPYKQVAPVIQQGSGIMQSYLNDPASNAVYSGPRVADLSSDTQAGLDLMRQSGGANQAYDFYSNLLNSGAGTMNPQVQQMQDAIRRQVQAATNAQFSNAGMVGGTAHQESFAKGLADGLAQPLFAAYENDMARRMGAATGIMGADQQRIGNQLGAGEIIDSHNQARINADRELFEEQRTAPLRAWSEVYPMASDLGSRFGSSTQTQTQKTPLAQQIAGGAMMGVGLMSGIPGVAAGAGNLLQGAPWSYGSSWAPWVKG